MAVSGSATISAADMRPTVAPAPRPTRCPFARECDEVSTAVLWRPGQSGRRRIRAARASPSRRGPGRRPRSTIAPSGPRPDRVRHVRRDAPRPPGSSSRSSSPIRNRSEPDASTPICSLSCACSGTSDVRIELDHRRTSPARPRHDAGAHAVPDGMRARCRRDPRRAHRRPDRTTPIRSQTPSTPESAKPISEITCRPSTCGPALGEDPDQARPDQAAGDDERDHEPVEDDVELVRELVEPLVHEADLELAVRAPARARRAPGAAPPGASRPARAPPCAPARSDALRRVAVQHQVARVRLRDLEDVEVRVELARRPSRASRSPCRAGRTASAAAGSSSR